MVVTGGSQITAVPVIATLVGQADASQAEALVAVMGIAQTLLCIS